MKPEEIEAALQRGAWVAPPKQHAAVHHVSADIGCDPEHARTIALAKGVLDEAGQLHCWNCQLACEWHVSLHCMPCRVEAKRNEPERRRREREALRAQQERERERREQEQPSRPVATRAFR